MVAAIAHNGMAGLLVLGVVARSEQAVRDTVEKGEKGSVGPDKGRGNPQILNSGFHTRVVITPRDSHGHGSRQGWFSLISAFLFGFSKARYA